MTDTAAERWHLVDEQDFLQRSLLDAEREHDAGDLDDEDYAVLRRRDGERLAIVEAAIAALRSPPAAGSPAPGLGEEDDHADPHLPSGGAPSLPGALLGTGGGPEARGRSRATGTGAGARGARRPARREDVASTRRRRRRWLGVGGAAALVAGAIVLVVEVMAPRLPGETPTGGVDLTTGQQVQRQLVQAQDLVDANQPVKAMGVYTQVLAESPNDPVALAELGWLEWQAATQSASATTAAQGLASIQRAVAVDPGFYAGQFYLGSVLLSEGHAQKAVAHFRSFLADSPPSGWLEETAGTVRSAFAAAGQPVPAGVPAPAGSTAGSPSGTSTGSGSGSGTGSGSGGSSG